MKKQEEYHSLGEVREKIDEIDNEIIRLIGKRSAFIEEIVIYKNSIDEVYAIDRYNDVIKRRREIAVENKLDPDVIEKIYRIMMDYFIIKQLELLKNKIK
jgi:isochorismate pyruvate lyase